MRRPVSNLQKRLGWATVATWLAFGALAGCLDVGSDPGPDATEADTQIVADVPGGGGGAVDGSDPDEVVEPVICTEPCPAPPCWAATQDPVTCACSVTQLPAGPCDDQNLCTYEDQCVEGVCAGTSIAPETACDDGDPCTIERCYKEVGCVHEAKPEGDGCDDGNLCSTGTTCQSGECKKGAVFQRTCGICDPRGDDDCEAVNGDGLLCNGTLHCVDGICLVDPATVVHCAPTDSACATNTCDEDSGECLEITAEDGLPCTDGSACTVTDTCVDGVCVGVASLDPKCQCTGDVDCITSGIEDGDKCNGENLCIDGLCVFDPTSVVPPCDPTEEVGECFVVGCDPVLGECAALKNDGAPCIGSNPCTVGGTCQNGLCKFATPLDCSDLDGPCGTGVCNSALGTCEVQPFEDGTLCNETDNCVLGSSCLGGECDLGLPVVCESDACAPEQCDPDLGCVPVFIVDFPTCCFQCVCQGAEPPCVDGGYTCDKELIEGFLPVELCNNGEDDDCDGELDEACVEDDICAVGTLQATYGDQMLACAAGPGEGLGWSESMCPIGWHACGYSTLLKTLEAHSEATLVDNYWMAAYITHDASEDSNQAVDSPGLGCVDYDGSCGQSFQVQAVTRTLSAATAVPYADPAWTCDGPEVAGSCEEATAAGVMCCQVCGPGHPCEEAEDPCTPSTCDESQGRCVGSPLVPAEACKSEGVCAAGVPYDCTAVAGTASCDYAQVEGYEAFETLCDGLDNDCDGSTDGEDDDVQAALPPCDLQDGVCANTHRTADLCTSEGWLPCGDDAYGDDYEPGDELTCDDKDNNCDGQTDEFLALDGQQVGSPCVGWGNCASGAPGKVECAGPTEARCSVHPGGSQYDTQPANQPETCDGDDDDCDGLTDEAEALEPGNANCATDGVCAAAEPECIDGLWDCRYGEIAGAPHEESETLCDGADNDCDGNIDETPGVIWTGDPDPDGYPTIMALGEACGVEPCLGTVICEGDGSGYRCTVSTLNEDELCDDFDNDCDGQTDEGLNYQGLEKGDQCLGVGACSELQGVVECGSNEIDIVCSTNQHGSAHAYAAETCNSIDDDCDGAVDEDLLPDGVAFGSTCDGSGECGQGVWECAYGIHWCSTNPGGSEHPSDLVEICDGKDNDCDGETDEEEDLQDSDAGCTITGVCTTSNVNIKCEGAWTCDYAGVDDHVADEGADWCDGKDNDCDGATDEAYAELGQPCDRVDDNDDCEAGIWVCDSAGTDMVCEETAEFEEVCGDEEDNDCDGSIDEGAASGCDLFCRDTDGDTVADSAADCTCLCNPNAEFVVEPPSDGPYDCAPEDAARFPGAPEMCNGIDDDCDTATDLKDPVDLVNSDPQSCENTLGLCADLLKLAALCVDGNWLPCDDQFYDAELEGLWEAGAETLCDGLDNNCDGAVDEAGALDAPKCPLQDGVCLNSQTPQSHCEPGGESTWAECGEADYLAHTATGPAPYEHGVEATCDGHDNDCDGLSDEAFDVHFIPVGSPCEGEGECGSGIVVCTEDGLDAVCSTEPGGPDYNPSSEACNGLDDDCDGTVDEGLNSSSPDSPCYVEGLCSIQTVVATCLGPYDWDCNYNNVSGYEGTTEWSCDEVDNDCDGGIDEDFQLVLYPPPTYQPVTLHKGDECPESACANGNGQTTPIVVCNPQSPPGPELICSNQLGEDDDDEDIEVCDGEDNDCDGDIDEDLEYEHPDGGKDGDKGDECDGIGVCGRGRVVCATDNITITCSTNPGAPGSIIEEDVCNGHDDDCDGQTDEGFTLNGAYKGEPCPAMGICPPGVVVCDDEGGITCSTWADGDAEVCDGVDNDCDGESDEGILSADSGCPTVGVCAQPNVVPECVSGVWDCQHDELQWHEDDETLCDGLDNDCDGLTDEAFPKLGQDCDGPDADVCELGKWVCKKNKEDQTCENDTPQFELCSTVGEDDDCDGLIDEEGAADCSTFFYDGDDDGYGLTDDSKCLCYTNLIDPYTAAMEEDDCDDTDPQVYPYASEPCGSVDHDCDGLTDEEDSGGCQDYWPDLDGDGYGTGPMRCLCGPDDATNYTVLAFADPEDCYDAPDSSEAAAINPGATEICDDIDNNCDGDVDELGATGCTLFLPDADGDTFGSSFESALCLCQARPYYTPWDGTTETLDCCDFDTLAFPGQVDAFSFPTQCQTFDYDCDGADTPSYTVMASCACSADTPGCFGCSTTQGWLSDQGGDGANDATYPGCGDSAAPFLNPDGCTLSGTSSGTGTGGGLATAQCVIDTEEWFYQSQLCK